MKTVRDAPTARVRTKSRPRPSRGSTIVYKLSNTLLPEGALRRLRARNEWRAWVRSLSAEALTDLRDAPPEVKRQLFLAHVTRVEIEAHAKCNRICSFCPNAIVDRRRNDRLTDRNMLDRVFAELGSIDYARQIAVARYSEPLSNLASIHDCIARARAAVPQAELCITTNTDYLRRQTLQDLEASGLNVVYMSLYLRDRERWSVELASTYTTRLAKTLNVPIKKLTVTSGNVAAAFDYPGMRLQSNCRDWNQHATDRGGSLESYAATLRVGPCRDPFETFVIDHDGSVVPCCAIRSDIPQHQSAILGNLGQPGTSIFDIYAGQLAEWRRSLVGFGPKASPCTTCRHRDIPQVLAGPIKRQLEARLRSFGLE